MGRLSQHQQLNIWQNFSLTNPESGIYTTLWKTSAQKMNDSSLMTNPDLEIYFKVVCV